MKSIAFLFVIITMIMSACGPHPASTTVSPQPAAEVKIPDTDGCITDINSKLVNEHKVSDVLNLVKDKDENGSCTVKFDLIVDGKTYHLTETEDGLEQIESLCYYAKERARKNLLLDLGGTFKSESSVTCRLRD